MSFQHLRRAAAAVRENRAVTAIFLAFTATLLYQHGLGWNWDFLVYSMNGTYIFHGGMFMEWLRPPVVPVVLGLLQFVFTRGAAGYAFILLSSVTFLYAVHRFAEAHGIDSAVFYGLLLTPGVIAVSTSAGTELLSLAFVLLFLAELGTVRAGAWLGLAVLTRYTMLALVPVVLFQGAWRTRLRTLAVAAAVALPWLGYSYAATGDPLTGPVSFLALNTVLRQEATAVDPVHLLFIGLPTGLLLLAAARPAVRERLETVRDDPLALSMLYIAAVTLAVYLGSGVKRPRFLYPLALPLAYAGERVVAALDLRRIAALFVAANMVGGAALAVDTGHESPQLYRDAAAAVDDCMVESDVWVPLAYAGVPATHAVDLDTTRDRLRRGWRVVDVTGTVPGNVTGGGVTVLVENSGYTVYGRPDRCAPLRPVDRTRIDEFNTAAGANYTPTGFLLDVWRIHRASD